jgi:hypothetical protein
MAKGKPAQAELEDILRRLESSKSTLVKAVEGTSTESFADDVGDGESVKRALERMADDLNFYYGRLAARALNLPQPPCLTRADFGSPREGLMALQVAHRRFTNLLHDINTADLEKVAEDPEHGRFTLRQVLELAAAQYNQRAQSVLRLAGSAS